MLHVGVRGEGYVGSDMRDEKRGDTPTPGLSAE
jgi:hypothetical protein